jgi:site-specific recombinase XerD
MKLRQLIDQYVAFRKNLGAKFEANEAPLGTFSRFVGESQNIRKVKPQQVAAFLDGRGVVTRHWHRKYVVLRVFFRYAVSRGYLAASLLPANVPKRPERFKPYIYSREEIRCLLDCTGSAQTRRFQMRSTRFVPSATLYSAGLRVGEALSLNLEDVDLKQAVIIVRGIKFFKTRMVPPELK